MQPGQHAPPRRHDRYTNRLDADPRSPGRKQQAKLIVKTIRRWAVVYALAYFVTMIVLLPGHTRKPSSSRRAETRIWPWPARNATTTDGGCVGASERKRACTREEVHVCLSVRRRLSYANGPQGHVSLLPRGQEPLQANHEGHPTRQPEPKTAQRQDQHKI